MAEEIKKEKEVIFKETISMEEYKKLVFDCLMKKQNYTTQSANELMKEYEEDFPEFYEDNWDPGAVACGIAMRYL